MAPRRSLFPPWVNPSFFSVPRPRNFPCPSHVGEDHHENFLQFVFLPFSALRSFPFFSGFEDSEVFFFPEAFRRSDFLFFSIARKKMFKTTYEQQAVEDSFFPPG